MEVDSAEIPPIQGEDQAGHTKVPSPPTTDAPPGPSRSGPSLLSYFGAKPKQTAQSSAAPTGSGSASTTGPVKAKRSNKAPAAGQALLGTTAGESSTWALGKSLAVAEGKDGVKGKGKKKAVPVDGGEEAERKEMAKRVKLENKNLVKGMKSGVAKERPGPETIEGDQETLGENTASIAQTGASSEAGPSQPRVSPTKRKRPAPKTSRPSLPIPLTKKSQPPSQTSNNRSSVPLISSPPTINLSSSTESDDSESLQVVASSSKAGSSSSLTTHPLFSRSNSAISKGASQDDAIDIDDSPMRTKVVIEISDSPIQARLPLVSRAIPSAGNGKVVHSFFGKKAAVVPPVPAILPGSESQVKPPQNTQSKEGKMNAFFNPGPKGIPGKLSDGWGGNLKIGEEWLAPLSGRGYPSHTGMSRIPKPPTEISQKRRKISHVPCGSLGSFFSRPQMILDAPPPKLHSQPYPLDIIPTPDHPAIQSIKSRSLQSDRETWCERYRPLTASQVLGNETESTYLRDWLQLLSVGQDGSAGPSNPKITRRVPRRKAGALVDDWIVDDIGLYSDDLPPESQEEEGEMEYEPITEAPSSLDKRPESYPKFKERLANTMLLSGPTGTGKSAAVYAVAEELGWEVFEVYPGIGRRNASNLMALVGDVGRNHVITGKGKGKITPKKAKSSAPAPKAKPSAQSFFGGAGVRPINGVAGAKSVNGVSVVRKRANQLPSSSQGSMDDPLRVGDSDDELDEGIGEEADVLEDRKHGFRETLILLDEADLLYDEEATFWPAVIPLIAESRRPVILTCNDPQLIPIPSLPLQAILQFQPPSKDIAIPYLQSVAAHESLLHFDPISLYNSSFSSPPDLLAQPSPLCPNGHEPIPTFDLRKAITQLQLDRGKSSCSPLRAEEVIELPALVAGIEQRSFTDAWIAPRPWAVVEMNEIDCYGDTIDDLLSVDVLSKPEVHPDIPVLAAYSAEKEIVEYLLSLAPLPNSMASDNLGQDQIAHIRSLLPLLDPLIPLSSNLLPHFSLFTDYIPILRSIVLADDLLEIAEEEALATGGERLHRKTGRPMRSLTGWLKGKEENLGYARYLKGVDKEGEDVVRYRQLGLRLEH